MNKSYLTGPLKTRTWQLESYLINALPQTLTLNQRRYFKTFQNSGQFIDADGSSGKWQMPILDSLVEKYENFPSGTPAIQGYKIISISNQNLILQYVINGTTFTTTFKAL
jgi:spore cortex formation protein SpoVR/YcgB (stage V sporulation)